LLLLCQKQGEYLQALKELTKTGAEVNTILYHVFVL